MRSCNCYVQSILDRKWSRSVKAILLSGGMDSIALAYWLRPQVAITIDYGQVAATAELQAASAVASELGMRHSVVAANCGQLGQGQMAGKRRLRESPSAEWWPFRNQLLITLGAMSLAGSGAQELMIGTVANDQLHADGRREFVQAINELVSAQEFGLRVAAPAIHLTTVELIITSAIPPEILAWAHSCHACSVACGTCRGCNKHRETYEALGMPSY